MTGRPCPTLPIHNGGPSPDTLSYAAPRVVAYIDDRAIRAVTEFCRSLPPPSGRVHVPGRGRDPLRAIVGRTRDEAK